MKLFTLNFLTCATKSCRAAAAASATITTSERDDAAPPFPLQIRDAELARTELDFQPEFWRNVLPRIDWPAMQTVLASVGLALPAAVQARVLAESAGAEVQMADADAPPGLVKVGGEGVDEPEELDEEALRALHGLLMETQVVEGELVCARCGHRYAVKEGIANFLLPPHLV